MFIWLFNFLKIVINFLLFLFYYFILFLLFFILIFIVSILYYCMRTAFHCKSFLVTDIIKTKIRLSFFYLLILLNNKQLIFSKFFNILQNSLAFFKDLIPRNREYFYFTLKIKLIYLRNFYSKYSFWMILAIHL